MTANSYLTSLASKLVLEENEKSSITTSITALSSKLSTYFGSNVVEKFQFGSSTRGTILPRKVDENSDIDYMIVFNNTEGFTPQTFLNRLKLFAEKYYSSSEIKQSWPTIKLELNHITFELVPAYKCSWGGYFIPDKNIKWIRTIPNDINRNLINANISNYSIVKPTIRLIKHWNISNNSKSFNSYELESELISLFSYKHTYKITLTDFCIKSLEKLKTKTLYNTDTYNRLNKAITTLNEILSDEKRYPSLAQNELKKIFPEV